MSRQSKLSANDSLTESIILNTELKTSAIDVFADEKYIENSISHQSEPELQKNSKPISSLHHRDSTRNSSSRKDPAQFLRDETTSSERRNRDIREQSYRVDRDRRGLAASNHVDKMNRSDGDRRRSNDSNRQKGPKDDHDRRSKYSRSEGSSRKMSSERSDDKDHNDESDSWREGERRRSDGRGASRRSSRHEDTGRQAIRTPHVSRRASIDFPSRDESNGVAKHSRRRSSFHSESKSGRGLDSRTNHD
jgi:hypothetical protein